MIRRALPVPLVDDQGRRGTEPVWLAGRNGKRMRATFPERPAILITSIGPEEEYRWKDSVTTGAEIQAWMTDGTAQGMLPWFTKFNGVVPDKRWVEPVVDSFRLHADLEPVLGAMTPTAEIAMLDPATTLRHHAPELRKEAEADDLGFYHALIEARLPFEMLSDQVMTAEALDRFKVVILANATCLSDEQCAALKAYVGRGGSVVAAYETSTRDAAGKPRADLGLGDLFGVRLTGSSRGPVKNTYVAINGSHPISEGFEGAERIIGGTHLMAVEPTAGYGGAVPLCAGFPRSADGGGLSARGAAGRRGGRARARGRRADRLHPLEHRRDLLGGAGRRPCAPDRQCGALGARASGRASRSRAGPCSTSPCARARTRLPWPWSISPIR